jgi:16S rRNA (cytosine1402-N4)-methyltransferase
VDGVFLDIGVSSMHLDDPEKGFSFSKEGPLDMRMDPKLRTTASDVVNRFSEKKLVEIFKEYGEERKSYKAAKAIVEYRRKKKITSTKELAEILKGVCFKKPHLHPATLVFQALRIYVNDELAALEEGIDKAIDCLNNRKRIGVISFHRLEDRIVKEAFKKLNKKKGKILTKKPIEATTEETKKNPRARSAKMRFFEKEE